MPMLSNIGNPQVYEDGDQRPHHKGIREAGEHKPQTSSDRTTIDLDTRDDQSLASKLESMRPHEHHQEENKRTIHDPLAPAREHGNEPSRGAKIDANIQAEEQELLRRKGKI